MTKRLLFPVSMLSLYTLAGPYAGVVGLEAAGYSGHSLRAGLATSAAIAGASERAIMNQAGHKSAAMVRRYIRDVPCSVRTPPRASGCNSGVR